MKKLLFLMLCPLIIIGCATTWEPPAGCENSVILAKIGNVKEVDLLLKIVNIQALKNDVYTKRQALSAFDKMERLIHRGVSYKRLAFEVMSNIEWINKNAGVEIMIVSEYVGEFKDIEIELDACDKELLLDHIKKQRFYTSMIGK